MLLVNIAHTAILDLMWMKSSMVMCIASILSFFLGSPRLEIVRDELPTVPNTQGAKAVTALAYTAQCLVLAWGYITMTVLFLM